LRAQALCATVTNVGRIIAQVTVGNPFEPEREIRFDALVDTGSAFTVLPTAWKDRLGKLPSVQTVEVETADQRPVTAEVCGPVRIQIEGFRPVFSEVAFVEMHPSDGAYEPLVGYISLEQAGIAVDLLGHRLVKAKPLDLKRR
jgi:predicted aspartyl protease